MLVGFGLCVLRIFEGHINRLHYMYSCFVLLSRLFHSRLSFDLCVC